MAQFSAEDMQGWPQIELFMSVYEQDERRPNGPICVKLYGNTHDTPDEFVVRTNLKIGTAKGTGANYAPCGPVSDISRLNKHTPPYHGLHIARPRNHMIGTLKFECRVSLSKLR